MSLRESGAAIAAYDAQLFMASVDDLETVTGFARKNAATFPILSDPGGAIARNYGVLGANGYASRWTFYIDPEGKLAYVDKEVSPLSAGTDMLRVFDRLGVGSADAAE